MELIAITYAYTQDGIPHTKVIGIFEVNQVRGAYNDIKGFFKDEKTILSDKYNEKNDIFFIEYNDDEKTYLYSGVYEVGELRL